MDRDRGDRPVGRMLVAFAVLGLLSLGGVLLADSVDSGSVQEAAADDVDVTIPPTSDAPREGVLVLGNRSTRSMSDEVSGLESLPPGACFTLTANASGLSAAPVNSSAATELPCTEEHFYQLFWKGQIGAEVTDFEGVADTAFSLCSARSRPSSA